MNYLDKCVVKTDLMFRNLKQSGNLIVFILENTNSYIAYTLKDMNEIVKNKQNHYIERSDKLESFIELSIKIVVDSSLKSN